MAYTPCTATVAANIAAACNHQLTAGYTGRAVLINISDNPTLAAGSTPNVFTGIALATGVKTVVIDNVFVDPFNGSSKSGNTDSGMVRFTKNLNILIPMSGADASYNVIEPLLKSPLGFLVVVEKKDRNGDCSFEILGAYSAVKADPASYSRDESANGGAAALTLTCTEAYEFVALYDTDYATTKTAFETLIGKAY